MGVFDRRKATDYVSVKVVISFQALPGKAAELLPLLKDGRDISRAAEGCESFELFQRQDDENKFMFLEEWSSIEAHHKNMADNIVATGHLMRILPLIVAPPDNGVIQIVD
jgi:quinol monooxygenase YgiN